MPPDNDFERRSSVPRNERDGYIQEAFSEGGFNAVYAKYADMLFRVCLTRLKSHADAEDAVQDVFIAYFEKQPRFFGAEHEKAWFIRSAINRSHDILRKSKVRETLTLDDIAELPCRDGDESGKRLLIEVLELPEKYRTAFFLHYFEGYDINETAKLLSISVSAVKMRLARARETLKRKLTDT